MMCNTADICHHLDTYMKVMMNQWKVIHRKKGLILTQFFSCKKLKFIFFEQVTRLNLFQLVGIIGFILNMGSTSAFTPHNSDVVEFKRKINPKKLKEVSEVLKIEGIGTVEYTI